MKGLFFLFSILTAHSAFAVTGIYSGSGHYGNVIITDRGNNQITIETCGLFADVGCAPIVAVATRDSAGLYTSKAGTISVQYTTSKSSFDCSYSVHLELSFNQNKLFISEYGPSAFPLYAYSCPSASSLNYTHYIEPQAYIKK